MGATTTFSLTTGGRKENLAEHAGVEARVRRLPASENPFLQLIACAQPRGGVPATAWALASAWKRGWHRADTRLKGLTIGRRSDRGEAS